MTNESFDDITRKRLKEADPSPPFPADEIRMRIEATLAGREAGRKRPPGNHSPLRPTLRGLAVLAASLVLFVSGVEYGRRLPPEAAGQQAVETTRVDPIRSVPLTIQHSGSDYISSLTHLSDVAGALSDEEKEQARQVALAVLYGAAVELLRQQPDDPVAARLFETIRAEREQASRPDQEPGIWF